MGTGRKDTLTPVVVCDLDGTLVAVNSFTLFFGFAARAALRKGLLISLGSLLGGLALRKLRFISHERLKRRVLAVAPRVLDSSDVSKFVGRLSRHTRADVQQMLHDARDRGSRLMLATAAPELYAAPFGSALGFDLVSATSGDVDDPAWRENKREVKRDAVVALCSALGLQPELLITDHDDDLPLAEVCRRTVRVK